MSDQDFLPPEQTEQTGQGDLLEQLLVIAAEKAAKREADDALKKGFVTREQINAALAAFGENLKGDIVSSIVEQLAPKTESIVKKALDADERIAQRRSTVASEEDERDADPVSYVLKKGRTLGPESFDEVDKQLIWGLTYNALSQGMSNGEVPGER